MAGILLPFTTFAGAFALPATPLASADARATLTREQFIVDLAEQLKLPPYAGAAQAFSDVPSSDPDFGYVMAAYEKGWIAGFPDGLFRPQSALTREQIAKIEVIALGLQATSQSLASRPNYADAASIGRWAWGYIDEATAIGVLRGFTGGAFGPKSTFTPAEERYAIAQLQAYLAENSPAPPAAPTPPAPPAPPRAATYAPGFTTAPVVIASVYAPGYTTIAASPIGSDTLTVVVSSGAIATPLLGSAAPLAGAGVTTDFSSGHDLPAALGDYVGVYDVNGSGAVEAFSLIGPLANGQIAAAAPAISMISAAPGSALGDTTLTLTPSVAGDTFRVQDVGTTPGATPPVGAIPASGAIAYAPGSNLPVTAGDYLDVSELNGSGKIVAFRELAITDAQIAAAASEIVSAHAQAGSVSGTTAITLTPSAIGDTFRAKDVGGGVTAIPLVGATPPIGATTYTSGGNLAAAPGDHLDLYELDGSDHIVAFTELAVTSAQIAVPAISVVSAVAGSVYGTTAITLNPSAAGDSFKALDVGGAVTAIPVAGATPPSGAAGYTSGSNLAAAPGDHLDLYELDGSGHVVAFTELAITGSQILGPAPLISNITAAPGDFTGATALTLTPNTSGDTFRAMDVGSTATAIPLVGDTPPVGATTYTSGSSFIVTTAGDHVDVYELNASGHIVAFTELTITSAQIHP